MGWPKDAIRSAVIVLILGVLWFVPQVIEGRSGACNALAAKVGMAVDASSSIVCNAEDLGDRRSGGRAMSAALRLVPMPPAHLRVVARRKPDLRCESCSTPMPRPAFIAHGPADALANLIAAARIPSKTCFGCSIAACGRVAA